MKIVLLFTLLVLSNCTLHNLQPQTHDQELKQNTKMLILYHKQDRLSSKLLAQLPNLYNDLAKEKIFVSVGEYNLKNHPELPQNLQISEFPSLYLYENKGQSSMKYTGLFSSEEVFNWLKKYFKFRKSASKPVTDLDALELRMYKQGDLVLFLGEDDSSEEFGTYESVASQKTEFIFLHSFGENLRKYFSVKEGEQKIISINVKENKFGQNHYNTYTGDLNNPQNIVHFLKTYNTRGYRQIDPNNFDEVKTEKLPTLLLAATQKYNGPKMYTSTVVEQQFKSLREHFYNKAIMGVVNASDSSNSWFFYNQLKISNTTIPALGYFDFSHHVPKRIPFEGEITKESIQQFYLDAVEGRLQPVYNSEKPLSDEQQSKLLVKSLCRDDWDRYVKNNKEQDVVVFFYYLGCADCVAARDQFWRAAYRMKNNTNVLFARIDHQSNELLDFQVTNFPHFKMFKIGQYDNPVQIMFQNTSKKLVQFIKPLVSKEWIEPLPEKDTIEGSYKYERLQAEINYDKEQKRISDIQMANFKKTGTLPGDHVPEVPQETQEEKKVENKEEVKQEEENKENVEQQEENKENVKQEEENLQKDNQKENKKKEEKQNKKNKQKKTEL